MMSQPAAVSFWIWATGPPHPRSLYWSWTGSGWDCPRRSHGLRYGSLLYGHDTFDSSFLIKSGLFRDLRSHNPHQYSQSGLSAYLLILVCPSNVCKSVQASLPSSTAAVRAFYLYFNRSSPGLQQKQPGFLGPAAIGSFFSFFTQPEELWYLPWKHGWSRPQR